MALRLKQIPLPDDMIDLATHWQYFSLPVGDIHVSCAYNAAAALGIVFFNERYDWFLADSIEELYDNFVGMLGIDGKEVQWQYVDESRQQQFGWIGPNILH